MSSNKAFRFVPAGARINCHIRPASTKKSQYVKNQPLKDVHNSIESPDNISVYTPPVTSYPLESKKNQDGLPQGKNAHVISPPKTICKNKSLMCKNYKFKINEDVVFHADRKTSNVNGGMQISSKNSTPNVDTPIKNTSRNENITNSPLGTVADHMSELDQSHSDIIKNCSSNSAKCDKVPKSNVTLNSTKCDEVPKSNVNSFEITKVDCAKPEIHNGSFKSRLQDRLKKSAHLKERGRDSIQNHSAVNSKTSTDKSDLNLGGNKNCGCENCDHFITCSTWCCNNLNFDEPDGKRKGPALLKCNTKENQMPVIKKFSNKMILHGNLIPSPLFSIDQTCVDERIQKSLQELNCTSAKDVQSYIWPAVQRGLNVFMVGPPKSGKTLAYLPIFCTFCLEKKERYYDLLKYEGPYIIILCSNIEDCYELQNTVKSMTSHCADELVVKILIEDPSSQVTCDLLITISSVLEQTVKLGKIKLKRLCHLAIEDAHCILKNYSHSMQKLFQVMNQLQISRPHNRSIQVVISSQKWSVDLDTVLKQLYITPLVCFEDFLEASVYSKLQFNKKKLKSLHKCFYLTDLLKKKYMSHKTVVFCDENDISNIHEHLEVSGIESITISNNLIEDEIFENEDMWNSLQIGNYKVLLCTDSVFEKTVHILSAQWLVHFCFPADATQFAKRFRCLSANLNSPLNEEENIVYQFDSKCSFIIIDELCDNQLFLDFFQVLTRNLIKHLQL